MTLYRKWSSFLRSCLGRAPGFKVSPRLSSPIWADKQWPNTDESRAQGARFLSSQTSEDYFTEGLNCHCQLPVLVFASHSVSLSAAHSFVFVSPSRCVIPMAPGWHLRQDLLFHWWGILPHFLNPSLLLPPTTECHWSNIVVCVREFIRIKSDVPPPPSPISWGHDWF